MDRTQKNIKIFLKLLALSGLLACSGPERKKPTNCERFRNGVFYNMRNNEVDTKITRTDDYQIEEYLPTRARCKLKVEWIDQCTYKLIYHSGNEKCSGENTQNVIIEIIEVKESSYVVEGRIEGGLVLYKSELFLVKKK